MELRPDYYFDLTGFAHSAIFSLDVPLWNVFLEIEKYLSEINLGKIEVKIPPGVFLENDNLISIAKGTQLEPGCFIRGPCIIGKNCSIRHGAYIRGNVIAGDRCVIGHATEVKNSLLLDDAHAAHFAYLGDSILGNKVNLGAGVICANLRLNSSEISLVDRGKKYETGLRKFGAIIGDRTQIGCNSVSNPGTLIGKDVFCYPCLNFGGFIPANSLIKNSNKAVVKNQI